MSKAFTKELDDIPDDEPENPPQTQSGVKNYITPAGYARLKGCKLDCDKSCIWMAAAKA